MLKASVHIFNSYFNFSIIVTQKGQEILTTVVQTSYKLNTRYRMYLAFSYHLHYLSEKSSLYLRGEVATVPTSLTKWKPQEALLRTTARLNTRPVLLPCYKFWLLTQATFVQV